ncbi:MAG: hypothetical protein MZV65_17915 [Chromatiales bacterium]|nr:hypothetical protein [Chromatiales bacterium]
MIGVVLSLLVFLYKVMRPNVTTLARHEDQALRCTVDHGLRECEYIAMIRFDAPLFFANASYLEDQVTDRMRAKQEARSTSSSWPTASTISTPPAKKPCRCWSTASAARGGRVAQRSERIR